MARIQTMVQDQHIAMVGKNASKKKKGRPFNPLWREWVPKSKKKKGNLLQV